MRSWRPISEVIHLAALGVWLGALVMTAFAAAAIFTTMRALHPSLPAYSGYEGEHWRLAGGQAAAAVLVWCDVIQFTCAMLALVSGAVLVLVAKLPLRRPAVAARLVFVLIAAAILGGYLFFLAPRMNGHMIDYWSGALRADNTAAQTHQAAFDKLHPIATSLFGATTIAVLLSFLSGAWAATTPERNTRYAGPLRPPGQQSKRPQLEEPALLRTQR